MKTKRLLSAVLCAAGLAFTLLPSVAFAATAEAAYVDENGNTQTAIATVVEASTATLTNGWYVVNSSFTRTGTMTVSGDVHLILADGSSLTVYGDINNAGINVSGSNRLTIYGQEQETGQLMVTCGGNGAGIGGGNNEAGGTIAIRGGAVTAIGNSGGAAIGGGENGDAGSTTITGGKVTATGTNDGAAIGGGVNGGGGSIAISGGIITARARNGGAAIGGGEGGDAGTISISGGTVIAEAFHDGAGIGSGAGGASGDITINGGSIDVVEGGTSSVPHNGAGVSVYHTAITLFGISARTRVDALTTDAGYEYGANDLYTEEGGSVIRLWLPAGTKTTAARITDGAAMPTRQFYMGLVTTSSGPSSGVLNRQAFIVTSSTTGYTYQDNRLTFTQAGAYTVSMAFGSTTDRIRVGVPSASGTVAVTLSDVNINASGTADAALDMTGANVSLTLLGTNSLLSGDGKAGLLCPAGASLTVTAGSSGSLTATGGTEGAGIGGGYLVSGGNITIGGGMVTANGGADAAGIGCGDMLDSNMHSVANNSRVTINGGTVTANGGDYGAGIGSGSFGGGGTISINGGTVIANGGIRAPGIGTGDYACIGINNTDVTISDGTVQAHGGLMAAGIGGGHLSTGGTIRISGGTVTATGGGRGQYSNGALVSGGAGIGVGGGNDNWGFLSSTITISGGVVNATGGADAAGIGGGWRDGLNSDIVTISGGEVTATGGEYGAGIGGGQNRPGCGVTISAGTVRAYGGEYGAGIGGGLRGSGCSIAIISGTVTARGGIAGAGIGGGSSSDGNSVAIIGGTVSATGGDGEGLSMGGGAGIGSGGTSLATSESTTSGDITISGGVLTTNGGSGIKCGAGIGGGSAGNGGIITIRGGTITATGGSFEGGAGGAGIGGGASGSGGSVRILGGSVKAAGGSGAEAIGRGQGGSASGGRTNGMGQNVYRNTLTLSGVSGVTAVTAGSIGGAPCAQTPDVANGVYGIKDVYADAEGKVYFYLPIPSGNETINLTAGARTYGAAYQRLESGNTITLLPLADVTFTAAQTGGTSGTADSTGIALTFSQAVTGLAGGDITTTNGSGSVTKGALTGSGAVWTVALTDVAAEGTVIVSVRNFGSYNVVTAPQTVTVYKFAATAPSAPQSLTATPGDGQVELGWAAPASDGGSAILKYEVSKDDGASWTDADSDTGHTFTGLTNGQSYTFRVRAVNGEGPGAEAAVTATPQAAATTPSAPQGLTATPGDGQVALGWTAPASDGGSAILKYEVSKDNGTNWTDADSNTSHTFTGLTNGQSYTFRVRAVNREGPGTEAAVIATPQAAATTPSAPQGLAATPGDGQVELGWTAPASDGGSAILKYEVSKDDGTNWTDADSNTSHTFTGLTNGQSYTFRVRAVNGEGPGAEAAVIATPQAAAMTPSAPQGLTAIPGDGQVVLGWTAPASDGGSAILKYEVSKDDGTNWTDADSDTGHTFTGLTNGQSYTFRVRAINGEGPGAEATMTATPQMPQPSDPDYIFRTLTDSSTGISVSGMIHRDAVLTVNDMMLGDDSACDAIRQRMNDSVYALLLGKDISLSHGFTGTLTMTIPVGAQYNGQIVIILHCTGGTLQTYTTTVAGGKAVFSVTSLSPFAVFAEVSPSPDYDPPTVVTTSVTGVSATSAKPNGSVVADGGAAVTERGFVYGTTSNPAIGDTGVTKVKAGSGTGNFTVTLTELEPDTAYYVRAYATNIEGTAYGAVIRFMTDEDDLDGIPKTGNNSSPWVWWLLCGTSAAGIVTLVVLSKPKKGYRTFM